MAILVEPHQAAFDCLAALVTADTSATLGLNNTSSANHLFGGFYRMGDPARTRQVPRIEVELHDEENDAMPNLKNDFIVRLHYFTDRNLAFTTANGNQNKLIFRARSVFNGVTPSATNGWIPGSINRVRGQQAPPTDTEAHYVDTFQMRLSDT